MYKPLISCLSKPLHSCSTASWNKDLYSPEALTWIMAGLSWVFIKKEFWQEQFKIMHQAYSHYLTSKNLPDRLCSRPSLLHRFWNLSTLLGPSSTFCRISDKPPTSQNPLFPVWIFGESLIQYTKTRLKLSSKTRIGYPPASWLPGEPSSNILLSSQPLGTLNLIYLGSWIRKIWTWSCHTTNSCHASTANGTYMLIEGYRPQNNQFMVDHLKALGCSSLTYYPLQFDTTIA